MSEVDADAKEELDKAAEEAKVEMPSAEITIDVDESEVKDDKTIAHPDDPGQFEGLEKPKKDPKTEQDKLTPETPRFQEIWKRMKIAEDKIESGSKFEDSPVFKEMQKTNKMLRDSIDKLSTTIVDGNDTKATNALAEQLEGLEAEYETAVADLNHMAMSKIQRKMGALDRKIEAEANKPKEKKETIPAEEPELSPEFYDARNKLISNTNWMNPKKPDYNKQMVNYIGNIDAALEVDPEWEDATLDERFAEAARVTEERFIGKLDKADAKPNGGKPKVSTVEGASPHKGGKKIVKLDADQLDAAAAFGMTPAEYAADLEKYGGTN